MPTAESVAAWRESQKKKSQTVKPDAVSVHIPTQSTVSDSFSVMNFIMCGDLMLYLLFVGLIVGLQLSTYIYADDCFKSVVGPKDFWRNNFLLPSLILTGVSLISSFFHKMDFKLVLSTHIMSVLFSITLLLDVFPFSYLVLENTPNYETLEHYDLTVGLFLGLISIKYGFMSVLN